MDNCKNFESNREHCNCSSSGCSKKYTCCECMHHHREKGQLPACYFTDAGEASYDRSIENFIKNRAR